MTIQRPLIHGCMLVLIAAFTVDAHGTDLSTEPLNTYSAPSSTDVKPNVMFVLDDSGSMDFDYLPDSSNSGAPPLFRNSAYNGVYYNPAVTYAPPVTFDGSGDLDTATYPSMNGTSSARGGDANSGTSSPNWKAVKTDVYGVTDHPNNTTDLTNDAGFFTIVPGEYCKSPLLKTCTTSDTKTGDYIYPAQIRWCSDSALTTCQAAKTSTYRYMRAPMPDAATLTISSASDSYYSSARITNISVDGQRIMSGSADTSGGGWFTPNEAAMATNVAAKINACAIAITGNCDISGYSADVSGSTVTIYAPATGTGTPSVTISGSVTYQAHAFAASTVPGTNQRTAIKSSVSSYSYPGSDTKAVTRTDCAGTTCTYAEEMTNYANWYVYYRTRMLTMKTAASNAFATIDAAADIANGVSRFRLGYMSINNSTQADFLNLGEFSGAHKHDWYMKLQGAKPNGGTPLRVALANAGKLYAGKFIGQQFNGVNTTDPLQYSCQQNYTILSTDGFWNGHSTPTQLDNDTEIGNQDAALPRPYYDGSTNTQQQSSTKVLYQRTGKLQQKSGRHKWQDAVSCTPNNNTKCQYDWKDATTVDSCTDHYNDDGDATWDISNATQCYYARNWSDYSTVEACTPVPESNGPDYTTATRCRTLTANGTSNTLADVAAYYYSTDLRDSSAGSNTGTCDGPIIPPATTANDLCENNVPSNGRDVARTQHMTTFTLGLGAQGRMVYAPQDGQDYWNDTSGDFYDVKKGNTTDSGSGCSWEDSGPCNWPVPSSDSEANIDDLWHAAINGHGTYFSATDALSLASSLTKTLTTIANTPRPGTAAAAASSNPNVSSGDNYVFSTSYKSVNWYGELVRQQIGTDDGSLSAQNWSAMKLLDCATRSWSPTTNYAVGDVYRNDTTCYEVTSEYLSGAAFDSNAGGLDGSHIKILHTDEAAQSKTAVTAPNGRTIYTKGAPDANGKSNLIPFQWTDLTAASLDANFTEPHITYVAPTDGAPAGSGLSQFCSNAGNCLTSDQQTNTTVATGGAAGEALVNFLRGDRTNEGTYYRTRTHVLGDIVSSEARYVQAPLFNYADAGYADFKVAQASRAGTVYVAANDGMLHAFDATNGKERWAYIPGIVLPDIYKLADKNYSTKHQYFVDGTPETGDVCPKARPVTPPAVSPTCAGNEWKTILVGGLNRGGKGYYALDITDPAHPALLWEFTNDNLGYSYGNPKITKLADGTWVVLVTSGYNNTTDGLGRLYVLNAYTGQLIRTIQTTAGSADTPSGLARISAHVSQPMVNNTTTAVYGGDTLGNLWRFDINNNIGATGYDAQLLATLRDSQGRVQPITAKPLEATIAGLPVVFVGTGGFLGTSDVGAANYYQSFYAIKDKLDATGYGNPRDAANHFVDQTITSGTCPEHTDASVCSPGQTVRISSGSSVDWGTNDGWYIDFLSSGERASSDPTLGLGTLLFTTINPQGTSVSACGDAGADGSTSFLYALDYLTGTALAGTNGVVAINLGIGIATRPVLIELANGDVRVLVRTSGQSVIGNGESNGTASDMGTTINLTTTINRSASSGVKRVSWRELPSQ